MQGIAGMGQAAGIGDRMEDSQLVPVHDPVSVVRKLCW
jgi:hypothetical protein